MAMSRVSRREVLQGIATTALVSATPSVLTATGTAGVHFLVIGDWGRDGAGHQRAVAHEMGKAAEQLAARCVISVGDNFYDNGVQSPSDSQWRSSFESVYSARSLQIPWYAALGNHDYRGSPQAQIDYSKGSARWRMPGRYYKVAGADFEAPQLDLFIIDTSPIAYKDSGQVDAAIAMNIRDQDVEAQLRWLDDELDRSRAPWKIVVGHHTLHSGGSAHGDTPQLVTQVEPLLQRHGVQAYINGHDHDLQHIHRGGVDYIGCGGGFEGRPVHAVDGTRFCLARSGFAAIKLDTDMMQLEFRDYLGKNVYTTEISFAGVAAREAA